MTFRFVILLLPILAVVNATGPMCFSCSGSQSAYCGSVKRCENDEICYTQKYMAAGGSFEFRSGCEKKSVCNSISRNGHSKRSGPKPGLAVVCEACCDRDMCASYMCASRALAIFKGWICYDCPATSDPRQCKTAHYCAYGQKCLTSHYRMALSDQLMYSQGCVHPNICAKLEAAAVSSHRTGETWYNQTCCDGDFCNDGQAQMAGTTSTTAKP